MKILAHRSLMWLVLMTLCRMPADAQAPAGWKTYSNSDFGFILSYPPNIKLYNFARGEEPDNYAPVCDDTTIACFGYTGQQYTGTNFDGAGIAINILRDAKNEQQCSNIGTAEYPKLAAQTIIIHGTTFHTGETGEGGMSHYQAITAYRTVYQNVCFEIRTQINSVDIGVYDPGTIKEFDPAGLRTLLSQIVRTFRFIGPVKDGADWSVSRDSGCGGSFEFPAGDTLRMPTEYANGREVSQQVTCSLVFTHQGRDYTLALKNGVADETMVDRWLKSSGYPALESAKVISKTAKNTDYAAGAYYYIYEPGQIVIFSVSGQDHRPILPGNDPIYRHWLASFKL